jgi:uncharacterized protein Smg (DUF494 family)
MALDLKNQRIAQEIAAEFVDCTKERDAGRQGEVNFLECKRAFLLYFLRQEKVLRTQEKEVLVRIIVTLSHETIDSAALLAELRELRIELARP